MRGLLGNCGGSLGVGCWVRGEGSGMWAMGAEVLMYRYSGVLVYRDTGVWCSGMLGQ